MDMAFGRGGVSKGARGETAPPFLGEREGQGAGFPEIWGVPPLLKPPSPAATLPFPGTPYLGVGGKERSFRERREEGRAGSPRLGSQLEAGG